MAKILLHGNAPWAPTGYGQQLGLLAGMLTDAGHDVAFSVNWGLIGGALSWEGHAVFPATDDGPRGQGSTLLPQHAEAFGADLVIALGDPWAWPVDVLQRVRCSLALWAPVDCEPLSVMDRGVLRQLPHASLVAMSMHGARQLEEAFPGRHVFYAPHAYDGGVFHPMVTRSVRRQQLGLDDDTFAVGICAANRDLLRKAWSEQLQAFADFAEQADAAVALLIHSVADRALGGVDLRAMCSALHIGHLVRFSPSYNVLTGTVDASAMAGWYGALDLLSSCSMAEGFGVPAIEAQACGTPAIVTDFGAQSAMPAAERVRAGRWWSGAHSAWWGMPVIDSIRIAYAAQLDAWRTWGPDERVAERERTAERVEVFERARVFKTHWQPILAALLGREAA